MTRRSMTDARKRLIWNREQGVCYHCGKVTEMFGDTTRYDHRVEIFFTRRDINEDVFPTHTLCDAPKTAAGAGKIAKTKRLIKNADPETRKKPRMKSRPFQTSLTRGFDGKVRKR